MAKLKYPHGFEPITPDLKEQQVIERLKALYEETKKVVDEKTSAENRGAFEPVEGLSSYGDLVEHLATSSLLENTNRELAVFVACCIANIFGIFSPNVPIKDTDVLKDVLIFFTKQLSGLSDTCSELYPRYLYLLECLSAFNIFDLALELGDDSSTVLRQLIKSGFSAIKEKREDEERRVQGMIITQCSQLLQRMDQISNPILDAIFFFLVPPQKANNRESYRMARELIIKNQPTLEPYIQMFLNHGISDSELPECSLINERKIFFVIFELHEFAPEIVYPILGTLVPKLKSEDVTVRKEIIKILGRLFGSQRSRLAENIPDLWKAYMGRYHDVSEDVRLACVSLSLNILIDHPELRGQVSGLLVDRCYDPNDAVRLESLNVICKLAVSKFEALNEQLLECLAGRIRDKKPKVRQEAIRVAATIHRLVYVGEQFADSERASVAVIMRRVLDFYYQPYHDDRLLIEKLMVSHFVPYKLSVKKRMETLIAVFLKLDRREIRSFEEILMQQSRSRRLLRELFQNRDDEGFDMAKVEAHIQALSDLYSTPSKIAVHIQRFVEYVMGEPRLLQLHRYIFGPQYTCSNVKSSMAEIMEKLDKNKQLPEETVLVATGILERYAPLQIDAEAVEQLLSAAAEILKAELSTAVEEGNDVVEKILKLIQIVADGYAQFMCTTEILELFERMLELNNPLTEAALLRVLAMNSAVPESSNSGDFLEIRDRLVRRFEKTAREGSPRAAKYAVKCIVKMVGLEASSEILKTIVKDCAPQVVLTDPRCATALKALGSCATFLPLFIKQGFGDDITKGAAKVILGKVDSEPLSDEKACEVGKMDVYYKKHYSNEVTDDCLLRVFGMRFLCGFLVSLNQLKDEEKDVQSLALRTLKLLERILQSRGELGSASRVNDEYAGHMRVMAGCCIIKLATVTAFSSIITIDQLVLLASLVYDELRFVRRRIVSKLTKHLNTIRLPVEFMGMFCLVPLVKDDIEFQKSAQGFLEGCIKRRRKFFDKDKADSTAISPYHKPEYAVAYGLYFLAKLDSFISISDMSCLRDMRECLWFIISAFHRQTQTDASSLAEISSILEQIKLHSDAAVAESEEKIRLEQNEKLWALADIGLLLLSYRIALVPVKSYFKPRLSKRFFIPGPSLKDRVYVPKKFVEEEEKRTIRRKRNLSGSSTLRDTGTEASSTRMGRSKTSTRKAGAKKRNGKSSEQERMLDEISEESGSEGYEFTEENEKTDGFSRLSKKATKGKPLSKLKEQGPVSDLGLEEEASSRSPSPSSLEPDFWDNHPSTSHGVPGTTKTSKARNGSASEFFEQMTGISPIAPVTKAGSKVPRPKGQPETTRRLKQVPAFMSSTPIVRNAPKKRVVQQKPVPQTVAEETKPPSPKKPKLSSHTKTKGAMKIALNGRGMPHKATSPSRVSQRSQRSIRSAKTFSPEPSTSGRKQSQSPVKKKGSKDTPLQTQTQATQSSGSTATSGVGKRKLAQSVQTKKPRGGRNVPKSKKLDSRQGELSDAEPFSKSSVDKEEKPSSAGSKASPKKVNKKRTMKGGSQSPVKKRATRSQGKLNVSSKKQPVTRSRK